MKIICPHCKKDVTLDWPVRVQWIGRQIGPMLGVVAIAILFPLIIFVEQAILLYEAWSYRRAAIRGMLGRGDGFWSGRLGGLFVQDCWGPFGGFVAFMIESIIFGMLTEPWIAVLVFFLGVGLYLSMNFVTFVLNNKTLPPTTPSVSSQSN